MAKKDETKKKTEEAVEETVKTEETAAPSELEKVQEELAAQQDAYLRLAAEYDNFRKRSQKEKDSLYTDGKADAVGNFLSVFDNLLRAVQQQTADEAYKKGVEMTMAGLREVLEKMGVTEYGDAGDAFDPEIHNAVMHTDDDAFSENTVCEVFQKGFRMGEKIIRFAMVKVAN